MILPAVTTLLLTLPHFLCLTVQTVRHSDDPPANFGLLDISRFPHIEEFEENLKERSGIIDISTYMEDTRISEHLTDLPDELQQLQQQFLEVCQLSVYFLIPIINPITK